MKILLTRPLHEFAMRELKKGHDLEVYTGRSPMPKKLLISKIADKEGLLCYPYDRIDGEVIGAAQKLKAISTYSVGYDHIDVGVASRMGIKIGYTPEVLTDATADHTMALMLDLFRRVSDGDRMIRGGRWTTILGPYDFLGTDIHGKTLGILGMGRIGKAVAKRARGFDMKVIYHSRKRASCTLERRLGARWVSLDEMFRKSDVISIHAPHSAKTNEMVDKSLIKKMKKTSFLVNTARGRIINEKDLAFALKRGMIAGAALDVFRQEPLPSQSPLIGLDNVILTPHTGSATVETRRKMAEIAVKNLSLILSGKKPIYEVRAG